MKNILIMTFLSIFTLISNAAEVSTEFRLKVPNVGWNVESSNQGENTGEDSGSIDLGGIGGGSVTQPPEINGINIVDGWYEIVSETFNSNSITNSQWEEIKLNLSEGVKIITINGEEILIELNKLKTANCLSIDNINTINSPNQPNKYGVIYLYHNETSDCNVNGGDYSIIQLGNENLLTDYTQYLINRGNNYYTYFNRLYLK